MNWKTYIVQGSSRKTDQTLDWLLAKMRYYVIFKTFQLYREYFYVRILHIVDYVLEILNFV